MAFPGSLPVNVNLTALFEWLTVRLVIVAVGGRSVKVAVTDLAASIVTRHAPVPEHAPDHPVKLEVAAGVAVSVTTVPVSNEAEQVAPQLIPAGELETEPVPLPLFDTVSVYTRVKSAVTDCA